VPPKVEEAQRSAEVASAATPEELLRKLDELAARVEGLQASISIPQEIKEKDVDAVEATLQEYRADPKKGHGLQFGATRADLMRKYGMPDQTMRANQEMWWIYYPRQGSDGISFSIEDGVVQHDTTSAPIDTRRKMEAELISPREQERRPHQQLSERLYPCAPRHALSTNRANPTRVFTAVYELGAEVHNGGFEQFFSNSTGEMWDAIEPALLTIGAREDGEARGGRGRALSRRAAAGRPVCAAQGGLRRERRGARRVGAPRP
jgi:hypothetical protein